MKACKRQVRCTRCTQHRWMGNQKLRFKAKETATIKHMKKDTKQTSL